MKDSFEKQQRYYELGENYFWLAANYDITMKIAQPLLKLSQGKGKIKILDAGCGCGNFIQRLIPWGEVVGSDMSLDGLAFCKKRCATQVVQSSLEKMPFPDNAFNFIFALQVIEHIENDIETLKELYRVLQPGGFLIINVPAFMFLWGPHDEKYGHFRRYTKHDFQRVLVKSGGLIVNKMCYLNFFAVAPLYLIRKFKRLTHSKRDDFYHVSNTTNLFLRSFLNAENFIESMVNFPLGTFLSLVLYKNESLALVKKAPDK